MEKTTTKRGFRRIEFIDRYRKQCSLQESSLADEEAIWFGIDKAEPIVLASDVGLICGGWADYLIPDKVLINTRMHLTRRQVADLLPYLQWFVENGDLGK